MMFSTSLLVAALSATALATPFGPAPMKRSEVPGFNYDTQKVRGVNLGGWLLTEPFINPSLYSTFPSEQIPVDEFHLTQQLGKQQASDILEKHWDSWITEDDFKQLSDWGFNTVRLPVGYWAFIARAEDPYIQGQIPYIDKAIEWARNHNIKVWVDLHGVPGSQNGFDNSGLRDTYLWQSDEYPQNIEDTYRALTAISERYGGSDYYDVITGIELVNEPLGPSLDVDKLHTYVDNGYGIVRNYGSQGVIFHDAFLEIGRFNDWLQPPNYWNVVLDHHRYQVFSLGELQRTTDQKIEFACQIGRDYAKENLWKVTGEWSAALTDCTPLLNGVYRGARYDATFESDTYLGSCQGINDITTWSDQKKQDTRRFVEAQLDAYDQGAGWIYWTYKTEDALEWDVRRLIQNGLFPQPLDERQYPNQCNY